MVNTQLCLVILYPMQFYLFLLVFCWCSLSFCRWRFFLCLFSHSSSSLQLPIPPITFFFPNTILHTANTTEEAGVRTVQTSYLMKDMCVSCCGGGGGGGWCDIGDWGVKHQTVSIRVVWKLGVWVCVRMKWDVHLTSLLAIPVLNKPHPWGWRHRKY